jgi:hypothetical protein
MRLSLIICLFISLSCTKRSEIKSRNGIDYIEAVELELSSVSEVEWKVGKKRDAIVSMGLNMKVSVPQVADKAVDYLLKKYGIDTWVFKVTQIKRGSQRPIGFFRYDLHSISGVNDYVNLNLYYHAASVSSDFRRFSCPAFDHRYRLSEYGTTDNTKKTHNLFIRRGSVLNAKIDQVSFAPMIFSVGKSMKADYKIEAALYSSKDKRLYSSWVMSQNNLIVVNEIMVDVPSCRGVREELNPLPSSRAPRLEDLQIPK